MIKKVYNPSVILKLKALNAVPDFTHVMESNGFYIIYTKTPGKHKNSGPQTTTLKVEKEMIDGLPDVQAQEEIGRLPNYFST